MQEYEIVLGKLDEMGIEYNLVDHPPALTTEDADRFIEGIEGVRTKTLFLCNKKGRKYYLLIMDDAKRLDMKKLEGLVEDKGIRFCSPERLMNKLKLAPGIVSIFGLLNNEEKDVNVLFDKEMLEEDIMSFHVNDNSKTAFIAKDDMCKFVDEIGFEYRVLDL